MNQFISHRNERRNEKLTRVERWVQFRARATRTSPPHMYSIIYPSFFWIACYKTIISVLFCRFSQLQAIDFSKTIYNSNKKSIYFFLGRKKSVAFVIVRFLLSLVVAFCQQWTEMTRLKQKKRVKPQHKQNNNHNLNPNMKKQQQQKRLLFFLCFFLTSNRLWAQTNGVGKRF